MDPSESGIEGHHLAQLNLSWARAPLHGRVMAGFVARTPAVDAAGRQAPGFCWRHPPGEDDGLVFGDPRIVPNLSTWADLEALEAFVQGPVHGAVLRLGSRWFLPPGPTAQVLWWVPAGHHPTLQEARDRRDHLDRHGPTDVAFTALTARQPPA